MTFPCTNEPALFDTMGGPDDPTVRKAKDLCLTCPAIFMCRQQGRDGQEWGVWGGESQVERNKALGLSNEERPECGTYGALMVHRGLGERCEVCLEARREREREYDKKRRAGKKLVEAEEKKKRAKAVVDDQGKSPCPSYGAYKRHIKRREDPGPCGCREAYRIARKAERDAQPKKPRKVTPCPSPAAYRRHQRNGEDGIACGCRAAQRAHEADRRKAKTEKEDAA